MKNMTKTILKKIDEVKQPIKIMHVCGSHEHTIMYNGIRSMLPPEVEVVAGPGCPVCVVPSQEIDECVALAEQGVTVAIFGDMLRVPGTVKSLADAKSEGADVRIVYGISNAVEMAKESDNDVVFMSAGFETTAPLTANELLSEPPENFSVLSSHRLVPPALDFLVHDDVQLDGLIEPGHVCTIIGTKPLEFLSDDYGIPQVVSGFNPLDILLSIYFILKQKKEDNPRIQNEYKRAVAEEGNIKAQEAMAEVFRPVTKEWRGFPEIPDSVYDLKSEFDDHNARVKYDMDLPDTENVPKGCICGPILRGTARPEDCKLFRGECNPLHPIGACMVSKEGTCNIAYRYSKMD
ncbi:MAG: hydrogenase formation protein HypD [Methanosphaera sp.]|uniref:hydrogenase formation protein HypD n=1 Tax=Methanosphaera sp. TaxID=2666342 RepID=UPI0025CF1CAA|nr:hydrogenase formation protein HypD [Methanosphaera sp.]MCI5867392.1 hydrogenase formation protein HypD [Methanosphaera sp.]MDD6534540.1 hydrogenase formation protein HypD [Methanosphaera sp.]MDY3955791.1 hydrogenase formation protein HypD [Methanosphaera sp.]